MDAPAAPAAPGARAAMATHTAPAAHAAPAARATRTRRDPWFDNARFIAAVLIVVIHATDALRHYSTTLTMVYYGTWAFRLPVYIVIAGYFSHGTPLTRRQWIHLLRNILFVYLAAYLIGYIGTGSAVGDWHFAPFTPSFMLWFLMALFLWRISLPVIVRHRAFVITSLGVTMAAGFIPIIGAPLALSRTLAMWPLFLLGWYLRQGPLRGWLDMHRVRIAAGCAIPLILLGSYLLRHVVATRYFTLDAGYAGGFSQQMAEAAIRIGVLTYGAIGALAIMSLMPRRRVPLMSYLGTGSLYIYVLHTMVVQPLRNFDVIPMTHSKAGIALLLLCCAVLATVLASRPVRAMTRWLIQPRYLRPFLYAMAYWQRLRRRHGVPDETATKIQV